MVDLHRNALIVRARNCLRDGAHLQAKSIAEEVLAKNKRDVDALEILARVYQETGRRDAAMKCIQQCVAEQPKNLDFQLFLAYCQFNSGRQDEAMARHERLLKSHPDNVGVIVGFADMLEKSGDRDRARALLEPMITAGNESVYVATNFAVIETALGRPEEAIRVLTRHTSRGAVPVHSLFVLGKAYEKAGDFDLAFQAYSSANAATSSRFNLEEHAKQIEDLIDTFSAKNVACFPRARTNSEISILIAGRPRSGTTLLSKIIAAHPQVQDGGEMMLLNEMTRELSITIGSTLIYPKAMFDLDQNDVDTLSATYISEMQAVNRKASRIVDKSLSTQFMLGFVQSIAPKCRVIHIRRNAIDNCLACFTEDFRHTYGYDLKLLGYTYQLFERIMDHWKAVLDLPIMTVNYEDLVVDQEGMTRKIISFLGLEWDDRCLKFYEPKETPKGTRTALTLSYDQVRKPIYKTSVGRAKKFENHLGPLLEALADGEAKYLSHRTLPTTSGGDATMESGL